MNAFGLLPFIKTAQIRALSDRFSPKFFNSRILRQFSALTNVQTLKIARLDLPSFMPTIREHFGPFLPTLRALYLKSPRGSDRQIIFFIRLFQHLEDLYLYCDPSFYCEKNAVEEDLTLIPPFSPPLQGRLVVWYWPRRDFFRGMIDLFGEIRFEVMDLLSAFGTQYLLPACSKTLRVLHMYTIDYQYGLSLHRFNLSHNKCLQTLVISADSTGCAFLGVPAKYASKPFKYALSTLRSPTFSQVEVVYRGCDFSAIHFPQPPALPYLHQPSQFEEWKEAALYDGMFKILRQMYKVRRFQLTFCAEVSETAKEYAVQMLKEAVAEEKSGREFNDPFPEPSVTFRPLRALEGDSPDNGFLPPLVIFPTHDPL